MFTKFGSFDPLFTYKMAVNIKFNTTNLVSGVIDHFIYKKRVENTKFNTNSPSRWY